MGGFLIALTAPRAKRDKMRGHPNKSNKEGPTKWEDSLLRIQFI